MMRRIAGVGIVLLWLGMVGWQVRREYFQPELARLSAATLSLAPGVSFYTLRMGDRLVGQATSRLDTIQGGFVLEDVMSLELPALGQTGTAVARTNVRLSQALAMETFSFQLDSEVGRFRASGVVRADTTLVVTIDSGSGEETVEYKLATPPVFSAIVPIRVAMGGDLEVGNSVRLPVFDPSTMGTRTVELRVLEYDTLVVPDSVRLDPATNRWSAFHYDSVPAWRVAEIYGGVSVESWVDGDGRVLRSSSPLGFSMEKTEFELALQERDDQRRELAAGGAPGGLDDDVILSTAVESNLDLGDATRFSEVRFRLTGVDLSGFQLDGGRQTLRGDTLIVRRENWDALDPGYDLPYKTMDMAEYLAPEPLIQSDDERIIRRARSITAARADWSLDPKRVAQQLTRSVFSSLEKVVTISVPSAVQVLESGRGDCNEHTVLFVALARSLGLPARTAVGLVYLNGAFFYHAWPEVWLGGDWVAVDPTFGDWPADAAHIRFVTGGLAQQVEIVRLIGRLNIEVIEAVPAPPEEA
jgi:hypothetical protein